MTYQFVEAHVAREIVIPRPDVAPQPVFLTAQDGVPVYYAEEWLPVCGVRVVHPTNPKAPSVHHSVVLVYVPPQAKLDLHSHQTEETYCVLSGAGTFLTTQGERPVVAGDFVFLPSWAEHGIVNTGSEMLTLLLATSPANP